MLRRPAPRFQSPLHQALWSTAIMAAFGLAVRFIWGAFDPEMRKWTFVAIAPFLGVATYLQSTGRVRLLAAGLMGLGLGGLLFWTLVLLSGQIPITGPADYVFIAFIFAFPVTAVGLGWRQLRRSDRSKASPPS